MKLSDYFKSIETDPSSHPLNARAAKYDLPDRFVFRGIKHASFEVYADAEFRRRVGDFAFNSVKNRFEFTLRQASLQIVPSKDAAGDDAVSIGIEVTSLFSEDGFCAYTILTKVIGTAYVERQGRLVKSSLDLWSRTSIATAVVNARIEEQFLNACLDDASKLGNLWMASNPVKR